MKVWNQYPLQNHTNFSNAKQEKSCNDENSSQALKMKKTKTENEVCKQ